MIKLQNVHPWDVTPGEARKIQSSLANKVIRENCLKKSINFVAGVDVGFEDKGKTTRAAVAVLTFPGLELLEYTIARRVTSFPYMPGLLSFREIPAVLDALNLLKQLPDLILCDGQGLAHPRRLGIACHLGVLTGFPTIGVAKTRLIGTHQIVPTQKGSYVSLLDKDETIGVVLRTRTGVKPVFVSIGHKIKLHTAIDFVLRCTPKYRLPETTRWSDKIASDKSGAYI